MTDCVGYQIVRSADNFRLCGVRGRKRERETEGENRENVVQREREIPKEREFEGAKKLREKRKKGERGQ